METKEIARPPAQDLQRPPLGVPTQHRAFVTVEKKVPPRRLGTLEALAGIALGIAAPIVPPFFLGPIGTLFSLFAMGVAGMVLGVMARQRGADALGLFANLFIPACIVAGILLWFRQHIYPLFFF
jgi:hypothetical protein